MNHKRHNFGNIQWGMRINLLDGDHYWSWTVSSGTCMYSFNVLSLMKAIIPSVKYCSYEKGFWSKLYRFLPIISSWRFVVPRPTCPSLSSGPSALGTSGSENTWFDWIESNKGKPIRSAFSNVLKMDDLIGFLLLDSMQSYHVSLGANFSLCPGPSQLRGTSGSGIKNGWKSFHKR